MKYTRTRSWTSSVYPTVPSFERVLEINMERFKYEPERVKECIVEWISKKRDPEVLRILLKTNYPQYMEMFNKLVMLK